MTPLEEHTPTPPDDPLHAVLTMLDETAASTHRSAERMLDTVPENPINRAEWHRLAERADLAAHLACWAREVAAGRTDPHDLSTIVSAGSLTTG